MASVLNIEHLQSALEEQELLLNNNNTEQNQSSVSDIYSQLLITYLIQNDLVNSKFLWKRIPSNIKIENKELDCIWKIGKHLWKRDFPNFYLSISSEKWCELSAPLIERLCESQRERMLNLVARSYSVISFHKLERLIGCDENVMLGIAVSRLWEIDTEKKVIRINLHSDHLKSSTLENKQINKKCDHLLGQLTNYVTFLEN